MFIIYFLTYTYTHPTCVLKHTLNVIVSEIYIQVYVVTNHHDLIFKLLEANLWNDSTFILELNISIFGFTYICNPHELRRWMTYINTVDVWIPRWKWPHGKWVRITFLKKNFLLHTKKFMQKNWRQSFFFFNISNMFG